VTSQASIRISRRAAMQAWIVRAAPLLLLAARGGQTASVPTNAATDKPVGAAAAQSPGVGPSPPASLQLSSSLRHHRLRSRPRSPLADVS
jgi:hypothetical protein